MAGGQINTFNFLVILTAALGSFTYGFTVNVTGPVLGMPSFYQYFHLNITQTTGVIGGRLSSAQIRACRLLTDPPLNSYSWMLLWWWYRRRPCRSLGL